ncbi:tripartite tricarboxylate transporter TctB family protein [Allorhizobium terrae]|uniref:Tripartite tricarboxylate transporter TctB family protein n=1 Tax=Allorhizobium terrae TaxID=1848972 RepID=A0A4S3ZQE7_9HYPH|nr:tripartite tricarboxylate transporter TctB family protein [Allorhizobium terrae]THF47753.1 tripartite tricarboxylate transporter TctB family protein [Allorhizobium terrae]TWD46091.1 tripartite tricarboxylate transporter TctB family protein [Agrobacterium vitis]
MSTPRTTRRPGELVFTILLLAASTFMLWQAYAISGFESLSSAGAFPMAMTAIMVGSIVYVLARLFRQAAPPHLLLRMKTEILPRTVVVFSCIILAYSLVLETLGFVIASFIFLLVSIWFLEGGRFKRAMLFSIVSIICVYIVFRLIFQVVLPEGLIPEREIIAAIQDLLAGRH